MIPSSNIASIYVKIVGDNSLLSIAQNNLLNNLERIRKVRTYTFFANNAQTELGVSRNYGNDRYYSWEDTIIDCRNSPNLINSSLLEEFDDIIAQNMRFQCFKNDIEERSGNLIKVTSFHKVILGRENMRYNIKRSSKIEDFDMIRIGIRLFANSDEDFKQALKNLYDYENPFLIRKTIAKA